MILDQRHLASARAYVSPTSFAWVHLGLNEIDATYKWMDKAIDERDPNINPIKTFPFLDSIRMDPRFPGLLRKMNLA